MLKKDEDATVETMPNPNRYLAFTLAFSLAFTPTLTPTLSQPEPGRHDALAHVDGGEREGGDRRAH